MLIHIDKPDPLFRDVCTAAFPGYRGRTYLMAVTDQLYMESVWKGGSRDYFAYVRLADLKKIDVPSGKGTLPIPPDVACVKCSIRHGDQGTSRTSLTVYVRPENAAPLLPPDAAELTWAEMVVLAAHSFRSWKRFREAVNETGITSYEWLPAQQALMVNGCLTKGGAITVKGRNAIGEKTLRMLRVGLKRDS